MLEELRRLLSHYYNRICSYVLAAPPGSLQLTGVLGLAALVLAWYNLRRGDGSPGSRGAAGAGASGRSGAVPAAAGAGAPGRLAAGANGSSSSSSSTGSGSGSKLPGAGDGERPLAEQAGASSTVRSKLSGVRKVTISALGPLTEEWTPAELQEGATLRAGAVALLREVAACADTYVITQVDDDIGQAVVTGSLEAAGLVGGQLGQLRPHRLLFCSTLAGKVSVVRQIEPDLHIDGSARTIEDLKRFMPQLLHIAPPGEAPAGLGSANVASSPSLEAFFGSS